MVNERRQRGVPNWQRQAWFTEYQACQHDNSSSSLSYWTLAGILIGISSVLLGGLVYGMLANYDLFGNFINVLLEGKGAAKGDLLLLKIVNSVILLASIGIILVFYFLKRWLKRVAFLGHLNYERMREIEDDLGMWKSWRVHGIDQWNELTNEEKDRLTRYKPQDWWQNQRNSCEYERPSSDYVDKAIFYILMSAWAIIGLAALSTLIGAYF
jgi:hypothetical protein